MFINDLSIYTNELQLSSNPSWEDIKVALEKLDGENCSEVTVGVGEDEEPFMTIVGGDQYFMVSVNKDSKTYVLIGNSVFLEKNSVVTLYASGQEIDCPRKFAADYASMLIAVCTFAHLGELDSSLQWSESLLSI